MVNSYVKRIPKISNFGKLSYLKNTISSSTLLLVTTAILFSNSACKKKESRGLEHDPQLQLAELLNQSRPQEALDLIENKLSQHPGNSDLEYWKAQALAMRAGVDVYALFPLLKMKLFEVAMNEWSSMNRLEERNRQRNSFGILGELDGLELSSEELEGYISSIRNTPYGEMDYEIKIEFQKYPLTQTENVNIYCVGKMFFVSPIYPIKEDITLNWYYKIDDPDVECESFREDFIKEGLNRSEFFRSEALKYYSNKLNKLKSRTRNERTIKASFSLFDSLPILRKIPELKLSAFKDLRLSLEILEGLRQKFPNTHRLGKNARQQIGLLAGYLAIGPLRNAIKFTQISEAHDVPCQTQIEVILRYYNHIRLGIKHILPVLTESKFGQKNEKGLKEIETSFLSSPEELTKEQREMIIESHENYKKNNC